MALAPPMRALLGFIAAALSVLTFHQGMWALLHLLNPPNLGMPPAYPLDPVPPLGVPLVLDLAFWGGLYGLAFGLLAPRFTWPLWLCGLLTGIIASLVGIFIVPAIKGQPVGEGWLLTNWLRLFLINGCWGLGVGLIFPLLARSALRTA